MNDSGWQPIDTAPKTNKSILVWCPERQNVYLVAWQESESEWRHFGGASRPLTEEPTLWRPVVSNCEAIALNPARPDIIRDSQEAPRGITIELHCGTTYTYTPEQLADGGLYQTTTAAHFVSIKLKDGFIHISKSAVLAIRENL